MVGEIANASHTEILTDPLYHMQPAINRVTHINRHISEAHSRWIKSLTTPYEDVQLDIEG